MEPEPNPTLRHRLIENVVDQLELDLPYIALLLASTIIATLGLLQDSAAVVIGAMIIAPLFWPIMGLAVSLFTTSKRTSRKTILSLITSISIAVGISYILALIVPTDQLTTQVLARTQPTLLDLIIALASAAIGALALASPAITSATGVAISISLLPPLCVAGIALANRSWTMFAGSSLLFATNMTAIIFAGVITFYFLGLLPKTTSHERFKYGLSATLILLVLLAIPLSFIFNRQIQQTNLRKTLTSQLTQNLQTISPQIRLQNTNVIFPPVFKNDAIIIRTTAIIPENIYITETQQSNLIESLTDLTGQTVDLELNLLNTISIRREESESLKTQRQLIENYLRNQIQELNGNTQIQSLNINFPTEETTDQTTRINLTLKSFGALPLTFEQKQTLEQKLTSRFQQKIELNIEFLAFERFDQPQDQQQKQFKANLTSQLTQDLQLISPLIHVQDITITTQSSPEGNPQETSPDFQQTNITAVIQTPEGLTIPLETKNQLESNLTQLATHPVSLRLRLIPYQTL